MIDFLLDENDDIQFDDNGELIIGDAELQDVDLIIRSNPADWKEHPLVGLSGFVPFVKQKRSRDFIEAELRKQLKYDGKNYDSIKKKIKLDNNIG